VRRLWMLFGLSTPSGEESLAQWAKANRSEFYKLLNAHRDSDPDSKGGKDNPVHVTLTIE